MRQCLGVFYLPLTWRHALQLPKHTGEVVQACKATFQRSAGEGKPLLGYLSLSQLQSFAIDKLYGCFAELALEGSEKLRF